MAQNEEVEIVGGNNDTSIVPITARKYDDHPEYHSLVAALSTKKYATLGKKKEVLLLCLPSIGDIRNIMKYWRDPDLYNHFFWHLLDDLRRNTKNDSQIKKNLTQAYTSVMITDLYVLHQWNEEMPLQGRRLREKQDPSAMVKKAFQSLVAFVGPIMKKYQEDQAKIHQKRSKAKLQATGTHVQDTVLFHPAKLDPEDCPLCQHRYCMMVTSKEDVEAKQAQDDAEFDAKMAAYDRLPAAQKKNKAKPRRRTSRCQESACYCVKSHCGMQANGGSCPACKANGGPILSTNDMECICEICRCTCKVSFLISDRRTIALQVELDKRANGNGSQPPTNTASYFNNLMSTMVENNTLVAMQESGNNASIVQNAASLASNQILGNVALQSNVPLRNTMQQVVERTTTCEGGLDIRQLRANHRAGRPLNVPPQHQITPTTGSRSAPAMTGIQREQRFSSNRLSVAPIVPPTVAGRPTPSSISTLDDDSDEIQCLGSNQIPMPAGSSEGDMKRKAVEPVERPAIIKRIRKKANRTLRQEMKKSEQDDLTISKLKKTIDQLSSPNITKKTEEYFVDNEEDFGCSQEMLSDAVALFH